LSIIFTYLRHPLNRYTFKAPKTRAWVEEQCKGKYVLNLFAGPSRLMVALKSSTISTLTCLARFLGWMHWTAPNISEKKVSYSMLFCLTRRIVTAKAWSSTMDTRIVDEIEVSENREALIVLAGTVAGATTTFVAFFTDPAN